MLVSAGVAAASVRGDPDWVAAGLFAFVATATAAGGGLLLANAAWWASCNCRSSCSRSHCCRREPLATRDCGSALSRIRHDCGQRDDARCLASCRRMNTGRCVIGTYIGRDDARIVLSDGPEHRVIVLTASTILELQVVGPRGLPRAVTARPCAPTAVVAPDGSAAEPFRGPRDAPGPPGPPGSEVRGVQADRRESGLGGPSGQPRRNGSLRVRADELVQEGDVANVVHADRPGLAGHAGHAVARHGPARHPPRPVGSTS